MFFSHNCGAVLRSFLSISVFWGGFWLFLAKRNLSFFLTSLKILVALYLYPKAFLLSPRTPSLFSKWNIISLLYPLRSNPPAFCRWLWLCPAYQTAHLVKSSTRLGHDLSSEFINSSKDDVRWFWSTWSLGFHVKTWGVPFPAPCLGTKQVSNHGGRPCRAGLALAGMGPVFRIHSDCFRHKPMRMCLTAGISRHSWHLWEPLPSPVQAVGVLYQVTMVSSSFQFRKFLWALYLTCQLQLFCSYLDLSFTHLTIFW